MRAKLHKNQSAIADYTAVVDMRAAPADIRAMALYNRALVYHAMAYGSEAIDDLNDVLEMADVAENIKTEARRKLVRMQRTSNRTDARDPAVDPCSQAGKHGQPESNAVGKLAD